VEKIKKKIYTNCIKFLCCCQPTEGWKSFT